MTNGGILLDPIQWIGAAFVLLSGIITFVILLKIYRPDFLRAKLKLGLSFSTIYLFVGIGLLFLAVERIFLIFQNQNEGIIAAYIANISGIIGICGYNFFAIYACFPRQIKKLGILAVILNTISILNAILIFKGIQINMQYEVEFPLHYIIIFLLSTGAIVVEVIIIFSYYSYIMKSKSLPHSQRVAWLAIAGIFQTFAYLPEIIKLSDIVNYLRVLWIPAIILQYICFTRFVELEWPNKIRHLYLIHQEKGVSLYDYSFIKEELKDSQLIAGGISGITALLQELTSSKHRVKIIDLEKLKILIEYGNFIIGALITEENYRILRSKLVQLVKIFEDQNKDYLIHFTGEISEFEKTSLLVDQVFHYEKIF